MVQTPIGAKSNPWIVYMKECRAEYNDMTSANDLKTKIPHPSSVFGDPVEARKATVVGPKAKRNERTNGTNGANGPKAANKKEATRT